MIWYLCITFLPLKYQVGWCSSDTVVVFCYPKNVCLLLSGSYECKLCLTLHNNEGSYLAHTQGKKHQANLARRADKEAKESPQQVKKET